VSARPNQARPLLTSSARLLISWMVFLDWLGRQAKFGSNRAGRKCGQSGETPTLGLAVHSICMQETNVRMPCQSSARPHDIDSVLSLFHRVEPRCVYYPYRRPKFPRTVRQDSANVMVATES
jgi:hypothetical protein